VGGTAGDLPLTRAADLANNRLVFDPVGGLFGLAFTGGAGALEDPALRRALAMAVDRQEIAVALDVPRLAPRTALVAPGVLELPAPIVPDWAASPLPMRRELAAQIVGGLGLGAPLAIRVAMPEGPGYRILFAHLRRDWRMIGIEATRVAIGQPAELVLVDEVAPANLASWYLRRFTCDVSPVCDPAADQALLAARLTTRSADRNAQFAIAERILTDLVPFIPLTAPVRWSLASPRLTGFRPSPFARHPAVELVAERP
jgi:peptide/nickel transport system substrate-binding protein